MQKTIKIAAVSALGIMMHTLPAGADADTIFTSSVTLESAQPQQADELVVALGGYDPTLYFAGGLPKPGKPEINYVYEGQIYYFTSYDGRQTFMEDPMQYAPQYGGHCAFAMSDHKTVAANPTVFAVQDNKLFLFENEMKLEMWKTNSRKFRLVADKRWELEAKNFSKYTAKF